MGKLEYLDALKRAMLGLSPEQQARTLAWYEQRFVDGVNAGRREDDIARELDEPKKVALTLRANTHMHAFKEQKNPANLLRLLASTLGLLIFNLFMAVPAAVFGSLLAALYVAAFASYASGIVVTASGLAGANGMVFDGPVSRVLSVGGPDTRTRVSIDERGIEVTQEEGDAPAAPAPREESGGRRTVSGSIEISTDLDEQSRTTQAAVGLAMVVGGIVLFLVSLAVTRYAALGLKRYLQMNLALLRST